MSASRRRKKGLLAGSLTLLAAGGTAVAILATTGGAANASIVSTVGGPVPLFISPGPISLPTQTNSIKVKDIGISEDCLPGPFDSSVSIDTGFRVGQDDQVEITAYNDEACLGAKVGSVNYTLTYNGPEPTKGLDQVLVRIRNPKVSFCAEEGWVDGNAGLCRDDG